MSRHTILVFVFVLRLAVRAPAQQPIAPPTDAASLFRQIEATVQEVRGLTFKTPVVYKSMTRPEFVVWVRKELHEQYPPEKLRGAGRAMALIGLLPEGTDLEKTFLNLLGAQAAAFYDHKSRAVFTFRDMRSTPAHTWGVLSHELTHALTDQVFGFGKFPEMKIKDNDDRQCALQSLVEGDACITAPKVMLKRGFGQRPPPPPPRRTGKGAFLQNQLVFPYTVGTRFVSTLYARTNSFELVNKAYRDLPKSTEQIMHPEKYYDPAKRDDPREITLPTLKSANWSFVDSNVLGQFGVQELLLMHLAANSPNRAVASAAGWDGDRYAVYELKSAVGTSSGNETLALWWDSVWDSEKDAVEFFNSMREVFQSRYTGLTPASGSSDTNVTLENARWRISLIRKADKVTIVQAPTAHFAEFSDLVGKASK